MAARIFEGRHEDQALEEEYFANVAATPVDPLPANGSRMSPPGSHSPHSHCMTPMGLPVR